MKNLHKLLLAAILVAFTALAAVSPAQASYNFDMLNPNFTPATPAANLPATCRIPAMDVTDQIPILIDCNSVNGLSLTPIAGSFTTLAATGTSTLAAINATGTFALTGAQTISSTLGVTGTTTAAAINASGVTTTTGGLVSIVTNDFHTPFSTGSTANPVEMVTKGTCTVASVNAGTCIPLAALTGRTYTVNQFDIIATGSAATCTGVFLEDTNGTPVVVATLAAATLTSGAHNIPLTATLGVGFGAGSGLTVSKGVQLIVNGSGCTTTTSFSYNIEYVMQ